MTTTVPGSSSDNSLESKCFTPPRPSSVSSSSSESAGSVSVKRALSASLTEIRTLPKFTANIPDSNSLPAPAPRIPSSPVTDFSTVSFTRKMSRPNSPSNMGRPIPPRSRIANIRRESDCSMETEVAHERYIKAAVQVSTGFEDFSLDDKTDDSKRVKALMDPISITILTSGLIPQASSHSPMSIVEATKQCYSPSTQQLVRSNISYSPSPSPTPSSPKRSRIMRSMSPIVTRQISKRRYTNNSGNVSGLDSDNEGPPLSSKRQCTSFNKVTTIGSPLVRDAPPFPNSPSIGESGSESVNVPSSPISECSTTSSMSFRPRQTIDLTTVTNLVVPMDSDESIMNEELEVNTDQEGCKDDQSSTTFSSRACTPVDEQLSDNNSRLPDEGPAPSTTPTGLVRNFAVVSPNPFASRCPLPPSPLASQRLRDDF